MSAAVALNLGERRVKVRDGVKVNLSESAHDTQVVCWAHDHEPHGCLVSSRESSPPYSH